MQKANRPDVLAGLGDTDRRLILAMGRRRCFRRGEVLFHEGDAANCVYLIQKGRVASKITTVYGERASLLYIGPGELVGELALVSEAERLATVVALEPTESILFYHDEFRRIRQRYPSVNDALIEILAEKLRDASRRIVEVMYVRAPDRVRRRVLDLAAFFGDGTLPTRIPVTQEDIAELAGTTRPTVNQVLQREEACGALRLGRGWLEVIDAESIAARIR